MVSRFDSRAWHWGIFLAMAWVHSSLTGCRDLAGYGPPQTLDGTSKEARLLELSSPVVDAADDGARDARVERTGRDIAQDSRGDMPQRDIQPYDLPPPDQAADLPSNGETSSCDPSCDSCAGSVCTMDCAGAGHCACPAGLACTIDCTTRDSCRGKIIRCPNERCTLRCGREACKGAVISCGSSGCQLDCSDGCEGLICDGPCDIHCRDEGCERLICQGGPCAITCTDGSCNESSITCTNACACDVQCEAGSCGGTVAIQCPPSCKAAVGCDSSLPGCGQGC